MWMWLAIGNAEIPPDETVRRMRRMPNAYRREAARFAALPGRMGAQMERVGRSVFPTPAQTAATARWAASCREWLRDKIAPSIHR